MAGKGHILIRVLKDNGEGRGQFGLTRRLEKKARTEMQVGKVPEIEIGKL